jgi:hypothetical protein
MSDSFICTTIKTLIELYFCENTIDSIFDVEIGSRPKLGN